MRFSASVILATAVASTTSAQKVVGAAYGFATGVTGGGSASAATPSSAEELAEWLSDNTARTIVIDKEYNFTGKSASGAGCDRKSCSSAKGGQLFLGDLSCGTSDNVVATVTYDVAGTEPLVVGSNKSIIGSNGKGVLIGKGLRIQKNAKNVIIQGITITNLNPGVVWGGDAIDLQAMMVSGSITTRSPSSAASSSSATTTAPALLSPIMSSTVSTTSASCNANHYWTMMLNGNGDQMTLDRNYFHDVSGRSPKLGEKGTFQATNNLFSDMKGHAFELYSGTVSLIEGNAFESVNTPYDGELYSNSFNVPDASSASSCISSIGRACQVNSLDSSCGTWKSLKETTALSTFSKLKDYLVKPIAATGVSTLVKGSAGPANVGSSTAVAEKASTETETATKSNAAAATLAASETITKETATEEPATAESSLSTVTAQAWSQCGGSGWRGATTCAAGTSCVFQNEWYSQCVSSAARRSMKSLRRI
ncbi:pectin lyase [Colletotrichum lupini]|uniref:pectin lyase n=1 Tax=Colletotrichum lupini TaxID=145971 RepID=A0A9Q8WAK6_9PEZI|nr:pectin lyase [Colletotrichum lupini]UQC76718.1 pectin lyase [Colletotrichum lupini]